MSGPHGTSRRWSATPDIDEQDDERADMPVPPNRVPTCGVCRRPRATYAGHEECVRVVSGGHRRSRLVEAVLDYLVADGRHDNRGGVERNRAWRRGT